jgi:hypothetical protein
LLFSFAGCAFVFDAGNARLPSPGMTFGERLREQRLAKKMTHEQLARRCGMSLG